MKTISHKTQIVEVWGDFACFSRPEMKVERFSYPCPTPSAARGIFEAIYFKPQFYWQVSKVELLETPTFLALRRNEVGTVTSVANVKKWMKGSTDPTPLLADDPSQRQQRQTIAIRNPHYRLHAQIIPRPEFSGQTKSYNDQFERRAKCGKVFQQPYFGCREFIAYYRYVENLNGEPNPVDYSQKIGMMLYDVFDLKTVNTNQAKPYISMFPAEIRNGMLKIPPFEFDTVLKPEPTGRRAV